MPLFPNESPLPLYYQVKSALIDYIAKNSLQPGSPMPTEKELQERFGVSRTTIRQAMQLLVNDGTLVRRRGKGTFVAKARLDAAPRLMSLTEEMREKGFSLTSQVVAKKIIVPPDYVATRLGLGANEQVLYLRRVRFLEGEPAFLFTSYLPCSLGIRLDDDFSGSLYELLESKYGITIHVSDITIEAGPADPVEAQYLGIKIGTPVLRDVRVSYSQDGVPVEYLEGSFRHDRYRHNVRLTRTPSL